MAKRIIYYSDPQDDLPNNHIHTKAVDRHFPFSTVPDCGLWRFGVLWRCNSRSFLISKIYLGLKFENHRQLRKVRASGYFLYGNHTWAWTRFCLPWRLFETDYIVAGPDMECPFGLRNLVQLLGSSRFPSDWADFQLFWRLWSGAFTGACHFPGRPIFGLLHRCPSFGGYFLPVSCNQCSVVAMAVTYRKRRALFCWIQAPGDDRHLPVRPCTPTPLNGPKLPRQDLRRTLANSCARSPAGRTM